MEREGVETGVVEVVGFDDVYYYSGHQISVASQVVNVEEAYDGYDEVVIVAVVDVAAVAAEAGWEGGKSVEVVLADESRMDERLVEGVVQVVEHIVGDSQLMADMDYTPAELAAEGVAG